MSEEGDKGKTRGIGDPQYHHHHQYGTFEGGAPPPPPPPPIYPPPQPVIGFPQPVPPPGSVAPSAPPPPYYQQGYQAVPVAEGTPVRQRRLPCCGIGIGWFLFIIGFFLAAIPWYVGAFIILCSRVDYREKPGFVACTIAAFIAAIAIILGLTKGTHAW